MPAPNHELPVVTEEETGAHTLVGPGEEPVSGTMPITRAARASRQVGNDPPRADASDKITSRPGPPESVVARLLTETLSNRPPIAHGDVDAYTRCIEDLKVTVALKSDRIAELELLLAQDDGKEILRDELDKTRAHAVRLEERLGAERRRSAALAGKLETLRSSVESGAAEAAKLEEQLRAERAENRRLSEELVQCRPRVAESKGDG